jgi:hypothetical protein
MGGEARPLAFEMQRKLRAVFVVLLLSLECGTVLAPAAQGSSGGADPQVRVAVFTDRYVYSPTDVVGVSVEVTNLTPDPLGGLSINSTIYNSNGTAVVEIPPMDGLEVATLSTQEFNQSVPISLSDANYQIVSDVIANGTRIGLASVPLVVLDTSGRAPLTVAFVFHMHQPIYLNLQGQFEQPWVQVHTGSDFQYNGTSYGAYMWYVYMLEQNPNVKVTFNLQPTLLFQWNTSMHAFAYNGTFPGGSAELQTDLAAINTTVAGYRALAADGQAEILTSPFYHPLSALLVELGLSSDLLAQMELGKNYTDVFMGVNAQGMWTPEMGFAMGMVPLMDEAGLGYTVLDGQYEFTGAGGPGANASMYQPFQVDGPNGSHIVVFFRDTNISNELTSDWIDIPQPKVAAADFIAAVANVYRSNPGGVLTIASDGENPIINGEGVVSALDLDAILGAVGSQGWLQTSTLGSIVESRQINATLNYIPTNSWSGGFGLWIGAQPKTAIWDAILASRKVLVNLTSTYGANNPEIEKLWNYLYIAEGSDWEWQTPSGPAWFAMQGYRYAAAAADYLAPAASPTGTPWYPYAAAAGVVAVAALVALLAVRRRRKPRPGPSLS